VLILRAVEHLVPIAKVDEERRLFGGWAYKFRDNKGNVVVDNSGDFIDTPEAEQAAVDAFTKYAIEARTGDNQHEVFDVSTLAGWLPITDETADALGLPHRYKARGIFSIYKANETDDGEALWQSIKDGSRSMLSIVGSGRRED
jgi:hypothetical protein